MSSSLTTSAVSVINLSASLSVDTSAAIYAFHPRAGPSNEWHVRPMEQATATNEGRATTSIHPHNQLHTLHYNSACTSTHGHTGMSREQCTHSGVVLCDWRSE